MKKKIWHFSKNTTIWIYRFFEAAIALFLVLFFLAFWKLYTEPMDAKFLLPAISKELLPKDSGYVLEVQSAELSAEFKEDGLFHLNMRNLQLIRPDKTVAIDFPVVDLSYGFWHIITLNYMPDKLMVDHPDLHIVIDAEGNWGLQDAQASPEQAPLENKKPHKHPLTARKLLNHVLSFHNLVIANGILTVEDLEQNEKLSLPKFNLYVRRRYGGLSHSARLSTVVQIGSQLTDIKIHATHSRLTKNLKIEAGITPLHLAKLGRFVPLLEGIDLPVSISLSANFNTRKKYKNFLENMEKMKFQIKALSEGKVTLPSPIAAVYPVKSAEFNGAVSAGFKTIKIAESKLELEDATTGEIEVTVKGIDQFIQSEKPEDIQTSFQAHVYNVPMANVPKVWPSEQGADAHAWVVEHLSEGRVSQADFNLTFTGSEMTDVFSDIQTEGVRVDYLPDMPALENVQAHVFLYPNKVEIVGEKGNAGNVQLMDAKLLFAPLDADITDLDIQLDLEGPISEMLQAINQQPLRLLEDADFDWNQIQGNAQTHVALKFPLDENILVQQLKVEVLADTNNAAVELKSRPLTLNNGNLNLYVNNDHLDLKGTVDFQTQPITVAWHEDFSPGNHIGTNLAIKGAILTESFKTLFPDTEAYTTGVVTFDTALQRPKAKSYWQGTMEANFNEATLNLYPIAVTKKAQEVAQLNLILKQATMDFTQGSLSFDLNGMAQKESLLVQGQVEWGKDWAIVLDEVKTAGNDFKAHLKAQKDTLSLNAQGNRWNLSNLMDMPLLRSTSPEQKTKTIWSPHMLLEAQLNTLVLNPKKPIENVIINAERKNSLWKYLQIEAKTSTPFVLVYNPQKRLFEGGSDNLGDLLSYLNLSDRLLGGHLKISATQTKTGLIQGKLSSDRTEWIDPGFLTQALSILGIVDAIRGKNIVFDNIQVPFELNTDGNFTLKDGYAAGSNLGVTFKGTVNLDNVDIAGSVIPAYLVNSLPGKIPLIGALFREGEGGGLLGIKYSIKGKPSKTEVEFHPLSSMAPGALGYIF